MATKEQVQEKREATTIEAAYDAKLNINITRPLNGCSLQFHLI